MSKCRKAFYGKIQVANLNDEQLHSLIKTNSSLMICF